MMYKNYKKPSLVAGALALACVSGVSYADSVKDSLQGSIVVTSKQEFGTTGYFHEKYTYSHPDCEGDVVVDYYGPEINPHDENLLAKEQSMCAQNRWFQDGEGGDE